jgi:CelD/BcsL family acetyltransferase involved in cellulose biosynthesis
MCSWSWTETWLRHYGDRVNHCFALGEVDGEQAGLALITCSLPISLPPLRFRGIVHIGTAGEPRGHSIDVEYNRLLAAPASRDAFATRLIETVSRELRPFAIRLDGFVSEDVAAMRAAGLAFEITDRPCPAFDLQAARRDGKDVLASLGSGVRSRVRRSNRGFDPLTSEWATSASQALDIYDDLISLHQARWQAEGRRGAFASERFAGFHREFIRQAIEGEPRVLLFRLRQGDSTIGCLYGFIENGVILFYQSGFAEVADNRLKPGLSTHVACMQECLERGLTMYDFLAGEARYKRELATTELMLQSAVAYRYPGTTTLIGLLDRLGLVDRARSLKRWRERASVAPANRVEESGSQTAP